MYAVDSLGVAYCDKGIAKQAKVGMIWVAGRSPTLVSHSEAWRSHES
jgi:hypothetical protein